MPKNNAILFVLLILLLCVFASASISNSNDKFWNGVNERAMAAKESHDFHKDIFLQKYNLFYSNGRRYNLQQYLFLKGITIEVR